MRSAQQDNQLAELQTNCRDKIEILHAQNNSACAQELINLLEDKEQEILALALLVCFPSNITALLIANCQDQHINAAQALSCRKGSLQRARLLRKQALSVFYQDISPAEFADSPLGLRLSNPAWLVSLTSKEIRNMLLDIKSDMLTTLLSCLPPLRVSKCIKLCRRDDDKQRLMSSLESINLVTDEDIDRLIKYLEEEKFPRQQRLNPAAYLGKIVKDLNRSESDQLLLSLRSNPRLLNEMGDYFLPFASIMQCKAPQIAEIFAECTEEQVAQTLLTADDMTQDTVLKSLPEVTRLGVKKVLDTLAINDASVGRANKLQLAVCSYLQALHRQEEQINSRKE